VIFIFTKYGTLGASSRIRTYQYLSKFSAGELSVNSDVLISNEQLKKRYAKERYSLVRIISSSVKRLLKLLQASRGDILYIEKELFPWIPGFVEYILLYNRKYILNYDDAIFHNYDLHTNPIIRYLYKNKIGSLIKKSSVTICGNKYLASYAVAAGASKVVIIPTVVDISKYKLTRVHRATNCPTIVWIGSPSTIKYLQSISHALQQVALNRTYILKVIGVMDFSIVGVTVECMPWVEESEVDSLLDCDIGIMPLLNTRWEQGKCGYKLIQYMACGLPVIASNLGANREIVSNNVNGYLASDDENWIVNLMSLLDDFKLRERLGTRGRSLIESDYSVDVTIDTFKDLLK
jgi:glycosyltransferase involved in cell wall biosynthesis